MGGNGVSDFLLGRVLLVGSSTHALGAWEEGIEEEETCVHGV